MVNVKHIEFLDQVFVRRPFFEASAYGVAKLRDVLKTNVFKNAIWLASPAFFNELEKKGFDYDLLSAKERLSALKFYNRMSFRGTPFGAFSGFGLAGWSTEGRKVRDDNGEAFLHLLPSIENELKQIEATHPGNDHIMAVNPTLYKMSGGWRYSRYETDSNGKLSFFVYLLSYNEADEMLLARLTSSQGTVNELVSYLEDLTDATHEECRLHVLKLLDEQVFVPEKSLSLLWNRNQQRVLEYTGDMDLRYAMVNDQGGIGSSINGNSFYAALELRKPSGLSEARKDEILETIKILDLLAPHPPKNAIDKFREAFELKFGERSVPLLEALDPDLGISYDGADQSAEHELLKGLEFPQVDKKSDQIDWSPIHSLLLKVWLQNKKRSHYEPVLLNDEDLTGLKPSGLPFPPSFSVLCSLGDNRMIFHNTGGATNNALTGRFSAFGNQYLDYCKLVAEQEQDANPDIMFAEILQVSHRKIDNINRRGQVYNHTIPLNCFPLKSSILATDIDVCVKGKEILLTHRPTGKRVIPRLPTAFNFHHNGMPLFRFLCA